MKTIPRRLNHCVLNGELFEAGSEYISCLDEHGERKDFCPRCWEKQGLKGEVNWRGKIPPKKEKIFQPDEKALAIFRTLKDPKYLFVLALYLQRKKQLVRRTKTLYEIPQTGEVFDLPVVGISAEDGALIAAEINQMIDPQVHGN